MIRRTAEHVVFPGRARRRRILSTFHDDADAALEAYFIYNEDTPESRAGFHPDIIRRAVEFDYLQWPRRLARDISGKDVLDVGCGTGLHAVGFVVVGVRSYTGLDPNIKLHKDRSKNLRQETKEGFGWTPQQLMKLMPRVRLIPGTFEDVAPEHVFDVVILHNVTEHLLNIREVFDGCWQRLRPNGTLIYNHHNFYCWNGHHNKPKYAREIDEADPEQRAYLDWAHLDPSPAVESFLSTRVNRIRLDEIRALTERYFQIETWEEHLSDAKRGAGRLTDAIKARYPQFTERELTTQGVFCKAIRRDSLDS
jgi:SAM-dependent methyltransferase